MNLKDVMILWNPNLDGLSGADTDVVIVPIGNDDRDFLFSLGGCFSPVQQMSGEQKIKYIFIEAIKLITRDNMNPQVVHHTFCEIKEYRDGLSQDMPMPEHLEKKFRKEAGNAI